MGDPAENIPVEETPTKTTIQIGDKIYDLAKAMPFNLGQLCALEEKNVTQATFKQWAAGEIKVTHLRELMTVLLKRIDPEITDTTIDSIELTKDLYDAITATFIKFAPGGDGGNPTT